MAGMTLREYVEFILAKVEAAGDRGDRVEAARLLHLLADAANEQAKKLEG